MAKLKSTLRFDIEGYSLLEKLDANKDNVVWKVIERKSNHVEIIKAALSKDPSKRLEQEFILLKRLAHPGIVKVYQYGVKNGHPWFSMEYLDGESFDTYMLKQRRSPDFADIFCEVNQEIIATLASVHQQGVVHADIKPANIIVGENNRATLLDFGFAGDFLLDPSGEPRGSIDYVAPEVIKGENITPSSDLYSLGVMWYEALSGRKLWANESLRTVISKKLNPSFNFSEHPEDIPQELWAITLRLLNPQPALRPSVAELSSVISGFLKKKASSAHLPGRLAPALGFGGREKELEFITDNLLKRKAAIFISGEKGVGKSRLMNEFRFTALLQKKKTLHVSTLQGRLSLLESIAYSLGIKFNYSKSLASEQRYEKILQAIFKKNPDLFLADCDFPLSEDDQKALAYIVRGLKGRCGVLICGEEETTCLKESSTQILKLELQPLSKLTLQALLEKTFGKMQGIEKFTETLDSICDGYPERINAVIEILFTKKWLRFDKSWKYKASGRPAEIDGKLASWASIKLKGLDAESAKVLTILALSEIPLPFDALKIADVSDLSWILRNLSDNKLVLSANYLGVIHYYPANQVIAGAVKKIVSAKEKRSLYKAGARALETYCQKLYGEDLEKWNTFYLIALTNMFLESGLKQKTKTYILHAAAQLLSMGKLAKAREFSESVFGLEPKTNEKLTAYTNLGYIASVERIPELSREYMLKALELTEGDEKKADIYLRIGNAYQMVHNSKEAALYFEKSRSLIDNNSYIAPRLLRIRAWEALNKKNPQEAIKIFNKAVELQSITAHDLAWSFMGLAWAYFSLNKLARALNFAKKARVLSKEHNIESAEFEALMLMLETLKQMNQPKEASDCIEEAFSLTSVLENPVARAKLLRYKAMALEIEGRYREARSKVKQALELLYRINDKHNVPHLLILEANMNAILGEWGKAFELYKEGWKKALTLDSSFIFSQSCLYYWGNLQRLKGDTQNALRMIAKGRKIAGKSEFSLWFDILESKIYVDEGNTEKAFQILSDMYLDENDESQADITLEYKLLYSELEHLRNPQGADLEAAIKLMRDIEAKQFTSRLGEVTRIVGISLIERGSFDEGLAKLASAQSIFQNQENLYQQGINLFLTAKAIFNQTDFTNDAISALEEAQTIFKKLDARKQLKNIDSFKIEHFARWRTQGGLVMEYLDGLRKISELINYQLGESDFMLRVLSIMLELTAAERGMVFFIDGATLYSVASKKMDTSSKKDARRISKTVIKNIQQGLKPIYSSDATRDERFNRAQSILLNEIRSLLCIPLKTSEKLIGTIYLDSQRVDLFDEEKTQYFEALGNLIAATIDKSVEFNKLREDLRISRERNRLSESGTVLGKSPSMRELYSQIEQVAPSDANILLQGETGTGKAVLARIIHDKSLRAQREFCSIDCGILPEGLFESELFGHSKGVYTGAHKDRMGLLETADSSTVFFDEITNTSPSMQAKLLEVIEGKVIRRLGESKKRNVNLRFIFATNRNLAKEVAEGRFRDDLFFRISTVTLLIPPLRERKEDIPEFIDFFVKKFSGDLKKKITAVDTDVTEAFMNYHWPGNIRELANVIERAILLTRDDRISRDLLDQRFFPATLSDTRNLKQLRQDEEKELIRKVLIETGGNVTRAARKMSISRQHLSRLMKRYGIPRLPL